MTASLTDRALACWFDYTHPAARYLIDLPIGNVVPLCVECCAWWRKDAAEGGDPWSRPVRITEIDDYPSPLRRPTGDTQ